MNEKQVQKAIANKFSAKAFIPNFYYNDTWEADILMIGLDYSLSEFEIKVTKSDFNADFNKTEKHNHLHTQFDLTMIPNYFWYVCPYRIIKPEDVPHYAGLIYIHEGNMKRWPVIEKPAPILHNEKVDYERWKSFAIKLANRI